MGSLLGVTTAPLTKSAYLDLAQQLKQQFPHTTPRCQHVGQCGGCTLQELAYPDQQQLKQQLLSTVECGMQHSSPIPLEPAGDPWRYRNKLELTFSTVQSQIHLGLHVRKSFWKIINLHECWLMPARVTTVLLAVRDWAQASGWPAYNPRRHTGILRSLVIRHSRATQQIQLCIITASVDRAPLDVFASIMLQQYPDVTSIYWGVTDQFSDGAIPEALTHLAGAPYLREQVGPFRIDLHPLNFLQPNVVQAEKMYTMIAAWVHAHHVQSAWDLYAGTGLIAFFLRRVVPAVVCVESIPSNIQLLQHNAAQNQMHDLTCRVARTEDFLEQEGATLPQPDGIIVDPPRAGLHPRVLRALARRPPRVLIYLSCNPVTLIQNLQTLRAAVPAYRLSDLQAFDMFPHTHHLEVLTCLET